MIEEEWGNVPPQLKVTAVDSNGDEIGMPICESCGIGKTCVIGQSAFCWICMNPDCKDKNEQT